MRKSRWMIHLLLGALLPATGFADDAKPAANNDATFSMETAALDKLVAEAKYASRWQLSGPVEEVVYVIDTRPPRIFRFQDANTFARMGQYRHLSLLTLAESGPRRLFLGVNEEGLLGLHFGASSHNRDDRYLELLRMPYLTKKQSL